MAGLQIMARPFPQPGQVPSPYAPHGVFQLPGYLTEGPLRRVSTFPQDWGLRGAYPGQAPGAFWASGYSPYAWRPQGDGTQPLYPTEADLYRHVLDYWPVREGWLQGAGLGCGAGCFPQVAQPRLGDPVADAQAQIDRFWSFERWKVGMQLVSTLAITTIAVIAVAAAVRKEK